MTGTDETGADRTGADRTGTALTGIDKSGVRQRGRDRGACAETWPGLAVVLSGAWFLAGCVTGAPMGGALDGLGSGVRDLAGGGVAALAGRAPTRVAVAGGDVVIGGPRGYCVDVAATRDGPRGAFVLLGSCAAISGAAGDTRPDRMAVLTASVSGAVSGAAAFDPDTTDAFFRSEAGRAVLSRTGNADSVTVLASRRSRTAVLLQVRDTSQTQGPVVAAEYWRAVTEVRGRIVSLQIVSPAGVTRADSDRTNDEAGQAAATGAAGKDLSGSGPGGTSAARNQVAGFDLIAAFVARVAALNTSR